MSQFDQQNTDKHLLRTRKLRIEPGQPDTASVFNFWLRTVEDFISTLQELRREDDPAVNKRRIIINCLSPAVYPHVEEAEIYDRIVQNLKALNVKRPVAKVVSCFFCSLDTHRNRYSCPARNASCRFFGKRGHFARVCRSKDLSTDVPSVAFTAPAQSVHRPFLLQLPQL